MYEQQGNALPALETYEQAIQILDSQARHGTAHCCHPRTAGVKPDVGHAEWQLCARVCNTVHHAANRNNALQHSAPCCKQE